MFFQARYYDPALGRFLQADAFVPDANAPQALDLYAYANNSPVNYVDPSGHAPVVAIVASRSRRPSGVSTTVAWSTWRRW